MFDWKDAKTHTPPQGKKLLCLTKGDVDVRQRFGKYWIPIPYIDSNYTNFDEPELFCDIELPNNLTGRIFFVVEGKKYNVDEIEEKFPEMHKKMIDSHIEYYEKLIKDRNVKS